MGFGFVTGCFAAFFVRVARAFYFGSVFAGCFFELTAACGARAAFGNMSGEWFMVVFGVGDDAERAISTG